MNATTIINYNYNRNYIGSTGYQLSLYCRTALRKDVEDCEFKDVIDTEFLIGQACDNNFKYTCKQEQRKFYRRPKMGQLIPMSFLFTMYRDCKDIFEDLELIKK